MELDSFDWVPQWRFVCCDTGEDVTEEVMSPKFSRLNGRRFRQFLMCDGESCVQQQFLDSTDVEKIYARCTREGIDVRDLTGMGPGQYGDVSNLQGKDLTTLHCEAQDIADQIQQFVDSREAAPMVEQAARGTESPPAGDSGVPPPTPAGSSPPAP